jgi:pimeloyl-ACP methyl ester carboxylesterase
MRFIIDGHAVFGATGGREHEASRPLAVFAHGAGLDHTVWALQSRWLAFHGWNVVALDLPGHGRSDGPPLPSIAAMAAWLAAVIDATVSKSAASKSAALIGHSMGALIALEAAARFPERVQSIVLIGAAAAMPVHPDLLAASAANEHAAIDMVNLWGHGHTAGLGGSCAPGVWMVGAAERILEKAAPGVLHNDLKACNAYRGGLAAAAQVAAPALLICGERDQMTPLTGGRALAASILGATIVALQGAGHMLLAERPYEVQGAIAKHLAVNPTRVSPVAVKD